MQLPEAIECFCEAGRLITASGLARPNASRQRRYRTTVTISLPSTPVLRRALMLHGDLGDVAATAMAGGAEALRAIGLQVGRGVRPMLASPAADIAAAMEKVSPAAVEWKLDGFRVQIHRMATRSARLLAHTRRHHRARPAGVEASRSPAVRSASCSTARRSRYGRTAGRMPSRTRPAARRRSSRCSSTCSTSTATTARSSPAPPAPTASPRRAGGAARPTLSRPMSGGDAAVLDTRSRSATRASSSSRSTRPTPRGAAGPAG